MAMINYADKVALNQNSNIADINKVKADDMNELKNAFNNQVAFGWYKTGLNPTFTFVSWDSTTYTGVVSTNIDLTAYLTAGMKIKLTQNSAVKYAFITAITSTQITLFMGSQYSLNSSAISNTYFSMLKAPYGFPLNPAIWSIKTTSTTAIQYTSPTVGLWYTGISIKVPKGQWRLQYKAKFECDMPSALETNVFGGICTSSNGNPIIDYVSNASGTGSVQFTLSYSSIVDITSDTTYYLSAMTGVPGAQYLYIIGFPDGPAIIQATIAYL